MIQSRTTLTEISKALNLSVSTISKSLSNSAEISLLTKMRVKEYAKNCNYTPNTFAVNFRKGYTHTIGLIIPNILNPFYAKVLIGVEKHLDEKGYNLITSISNDSIEKESKSIAQMGGGYVDGLIICVSKEAEIANEYDHINTFIGQGTPVVIFDRICEMIDCDKVVINDFEAAFNATEYLIINKGCKKIIMTSLIDSLHHGKLRSEGFKVAMAKHNLDTENRIIVAEDAIQLNQKLISVFDKDRDIDGVFGVNELAITQAMRIIRDLGLVKSTIEIAGFCNTIQSDFNPSIIVVNQNAEKIGMESAKLILNRIVNSAKNDYLTKTVDINLSY